MLPRPLRLNRSQDIKQTVQTGRRFSTPYFTAYYQPNPQQSLKIAVVVGKRVHKSSVARHRYQRWLRSLARQSLSSFPTSGALVIVGRPLITQLQKQASLTPHWQQAVAWLTKQRNDLNPT